MDNEINPLENNNIENNPYESPQALSMPLEESGGAKFSFTMLDALRRSVPWVRFLAIIGFISSGILILTGIIFAVGIGIAGNVLLKTPEAAEEIANIDGGNIISSIMGTMGAGIGIFYILLGLLYLIPSRFLYKHGSKIRAYFLSENQTDLEAAFKAGYSFWKFIGILTIVMLALLPAAAIISITAAIMQVFA